MYMYPGRTVLDIGADGVFLVIDEVLGEGVAACCQTLLLYEVHAQLTP
jgi:hypothetical protein